MSVTLPDIVGPDGVFIDGDWVESKDQDPNGNVRLVQLADVGEGAFLDKSARFLTSEKAAQLRCTYLQPGDILIARMPDPLGRACIFPEGQPPSVTVVDVCIVRPDLARVLPKWLLHKINSDGFRRRIGDWVTGTTRQRISRGNLSRIDFELPSLEEQRRITAILDKADALRRKRKRATELLVELSSAIVEFNARSTCGKARQLGHALSFVTTGGRNWSQYYAERGSRFIRSLDVQMNAISDGEAVYVEAPDNAEARRTRTQSGDVLLTVTGSRIGRVAALPEELAGSYVSQHVAILRPNRARIRPKFLAYFLSSRSGQQQIEKWQYGQTKPGLNFKQIADFEIPDINMTEQKRIEDLLEHTEAVMKAERIQESRIDDLFFSLQHRAFSGQL